MNIRHILLSLIVVFVLPQCFFGQSLFSNDYKLIQKCSANTTQKYASIELIKNGDIDVKPCPGKLFKLNGTPLGSSSSTPFSLNGLTSFTQTFTTAANDTASFASATNTHTLNLPITSVTGTSRANYLPFFAGQNALNKSDIFFDGVSFTAFKNQPFHLSIQPNKNQFSIGDVNRYIRQMEDLTIINNANLKLGGVTQIGDYNNAGRQTLLTVDDSIGSISAYAGPKGIKLDSSGGEISIGDISGLGNETSIRIDDNSSIVNVQASNGLHVDSLLFGGQIKSPQYNISSNSLCKGAGELINGIVTINSDCAENSSLVFVQATKSSIGNIRVSTRNHHAFTVSSGNANDNTSFYWFIVNQL